MAETFVATVEELTGDADNDTCYLAMPTEGIPEGTLFCKTVQITPTISFLVIGADLGEGAVAVPVEELTGDSDEDSKYLVLPKTLLSLSVGTDLDVVMLGEAPPHLLVVMTPTA